MAKSSLGRQASGRKGRRCLFLLPFSPNTCGAVRSWCLPSSPSGSCRGGMGCLMFRLVGVEQCLGLVGVQKRKLSLNDMVIASYLPSEWVCVLVFTSPNARSLPVRDFLEMIESLVCIGFGRCIARAAVRAVFR